MIEVARLTARQPRAICSQECGSRCCRTPGSAPIVRATEMSELKAIAKARGVKAPFLNVADFRSKDRWQLQRVNGACPFLGQSTGLCTIYDQRPQICRDFPTRPIQGCLLNPGGEGDPSL